MTLIKVRFAHSRWPHSLAGILDYKWREGAGQQQTFIHCFIVFFPLECLHSIRRVYFLPYSMFVRLFYKSKGEDIFKVTFKKSVS